MFGAVWVETSPTLEEALVMTFLVLFPWLSTLARSVNGLGEASSLHMSREEFGVL